MRYTPYRGLAAVTAWVKLKFAAMNLKKLALHKWRPFLLFYLHLLQETTSLRCNVASLTGCAGRIRDPHLYVFLLWFLDGTEQFRRVKGKVQHSRDFSCNFPRLNEKHHVSIRIQIKIGFGAERAGQLLL